jgi:hypothetical protein
VTTYGNRQTPYNLLQYYDFFQSIPEGLKPIAERMPRQAIYTLASRDGALTSKLKLIETYKGQTKKQLLDSIRETFPLPQGDKRRHQHPLLALLHQLKIAAESDSRSELTGEQKKEAKKLLKEVSSLLAQE